MSSGSEAPFRLVTMPRWGLSMEEGTIAEWRFAEGADVPAGAELVDIETSKIANVVEARHAGTLARILAAEGETLPCGAPIAVIAQGAVDSAELEAFVEAARSAPLAVEDGAGDDDEAPRPVRMSLPFGELAGVEQGTGKLALVLLHGFGGDAGNWMFVQPRLAAAHRTLALDLPGHGGSVKALPEGGIDGLVDLVLSALDAQGIERAGVVGHSLGAALALAIARRAPERVAGVALIAPAAADSTPDSAYLDAFLAARRPRELRAALALLFAPGTEPAAEMADAVARAKRLDGAQAALEGLGELLRQSDALPALADAPDDALVIAGALDRITPGAAGAAGGRRIVSVEGAGHMPHVEQPGAVADALLEHFAGR